MSWEIFVGITVLFAFVASVGKIIANNTQSMTEMKCSIDQLNQLLGSYHDDVEELTKEVRTIGDEVKTIEARVSRLEE